MMRVFLLFFIVLNCFSLQGQVAKNIEEINACPNKTLALSVHIVLDTAGNTNISQVAINASITSLNAAFAKMCLQFKICKQDTIPESMYDVYDEAKHQVEMGTKYDVPNTINIYYVIDNAACGKAPLPMGPSPIPYSVTRDFIFIKKSCPDAIIHEMGHFFGLQHTFETSGGVELANGSNCAISGDSICDTEADPYPATQLTPGTCTLTPASKALKDVNGDYYTPPICNIMSYYSGPCTKYFTTEQFNKMLLMYRTKRNYLW